MLSVKALSMDYSKKLLKTRKLLALTQRELAKVFRVRHGTITLWEKQKRPIPGPVTLILDNFKFKETLSK